MTSILRNEDGDVTVLVCPPTDLDLESRRFLTKDERIEHVQTVLEEMGYVEWTWDQAVTLAEKAEVDVWRPHASLVEIEATCGACEDEGWWCSAATGGDPMVVLCLRRDQAIDVLGDL